jgi:hypothetical protein
LFQVTSYRFQVPGFSALVTCNLEPVTTNNYNMKPKLICLLIILIGSALVASPNNYCGGLRCTGKLERVTIPPAKKIVKMIDDAELLPIYQFFDKF